MLCNYTHTYIRHEQCVYNSNNIYDGDESQRKTDFIQKPKLSLYTESRNYRTRGKNNIRRRKNNITRGKKTLKKSV